MTPNSQLLIDGNKGIYLPQQFIKAFGDNIQNEYALTEEIAIVRSGPEHGEYNDAWETIVEKAILNNGNSPRHFKLYQDGDLWGIPTHEMELIGQGGESQEEEPTIARVLITIEGGIIQTVESDTAGVRVVVVDIDKNAEYTHPETGDYTDFAVIEFDVDQLKSANYSDEADQDIVARLKALGY